MGLKQASFVERLSLSRMFHCTFQKDLVSIFYPFLSSTDLEVCAVVSIDNREVEQTRWSTPNNRAWEQQIKIELHQVTSPLSLIPAVVFHIQNSALYIPVFRNGHYVSCVCLVAEPGTGDPDLLQRCRRPLPPGPLRPRLPQARRLLRHLVFHHSLPASGTTGNTAGRGTPPGHVTHTLVM